MPRFKIALYVEVDADTEEEAITHAGWLCNIVTFSNPPYFQDENGIHILDMEDHGSGPIVVELDEEGNPV